MTATRQPIDLREVPPADRNRVVMQDLWRRLAALAAHVSDDAVDVPDAVADRVYAAEESAALELGKLDPDWSKQRQIAEDAWRDQLDDAPRGRSADWGWDQ